MPKPQLVQELFDPAQVLVADTWEDDPACMDLVHAIGNGACEGAIQCATNL